MFENQAPFKGSNHRWINLILECCDDAEFLAYWYPRVNLPGSDAKSHSMRHYWRKKFLRQIHPPSPTWFTFLTECEYCFQVFEPKRKGHKYCCNSCRSSAPRYRRRNAHLPDGGMKFLKSGRRRFRSDVEARRAFEHDLDQGFVKPSTCVPRRRG